MAHQTNPWDLDPAMTQRGVGPFGHAPAPASADPARYRLGSRLGEAGQVYEAHNSRYAGRLVVKLFPFAAGLAPTAVAAFTREAGRVADLRHPHIVQVIHAGIFADGTPFAAMERLAGQTLDQRIAGRGALPASEALPLVRGIASALSAAHAADVVHREVRADNVFIADMAGYPQGFVKLLDFGVSRLTAAARAAGRIVGPGTLRALAPEQVQGVGMGDWAPDRADQRTDQFALSALTYRLLTGAEPFVGQDAGPAFERLREDQNSAAAGFVRCTPEVGAVLNKAMSKRPENRFDSVVLFFQAFEEALTGKSATPVPQSVSYDAPTALLSVAKPVVTVGSSDAVTKAVVTVGSGDAVTKAVVSVGSGDAVTKAVVSVGSGDPVTKTVVTVGSGAAVAKPVPVVRVRAGGPRVDPSSATMRATVAPVGSLTQQFFAEGDRQEASQWAKAAILEADEFGEDRDFHDGEFHEVTDRVPKRRLPLIAAAVVVTLGVGAWAANLWSPFAWFSSSAQESQPAATSPAANVAVPAPHVTLPPLAPRPAPATTTETIPAPRATPTGSIPAPPPVAGAKRAPSAPPPVAGAKRSPSAPPAASVPAPSAAAVAPAPVAPAPVAPDAPAMAAPASVTPSANPEGQPKTPLRGYTWSARRRRLIRTQLAPLPTESPPPPAISAPPASPDSLLPPADSIRMAPADSTPPAPPAPLPPPAP